MTWETPEGNRWLTGKEAMLVCRSLACLVDQISLNLDLQEPDRQKLGVDLFDQAEPTEQLMIIKSVAEHLLTKTDATLPLTSVNEAAVYAIFRFLLFQVESELDEIEIDREQLEEYETEHRCYWRRLLLNAFEESFGDDDGDDESLFDDDDPESPWIKPRDENCRNIEQWNSLIESLADQILWDRDFEMAGSFLDADPATASAMKQMMGIEPDYFYRAPLNVKAGEFEAMLQSVRQLTQLPF